MGGGILHSETETRPPLAKMKGYFNWVSDACLILFSILIPYNVHNQNKYTRGAKLLIGNSNTDKMCEWDTCTQPLGTN